MVRTDQETGTVRVLLADDHDGVRQGIKSILDSHPDIEVVGEAETGLDIIPMVNDLSPDILVLDMLMPFARGDMILNQITKKNDRVKILVLSGHDDTSYITMMLEGGASGYIIKDEAHDVLVSAILEIAQGKKGWLSKKVAKKVGHYEQTGLQRQDTLTAREVQVLHLLKKGFDIKEISQLMNMPAATVEQHLEILKSKLNARSIEDLMAWADSQKFL